MRDWIVFLHVLSAVSLGFYILLPFLLHRLEKMESTVRSSQLENLLFCNRIGQYVLVVAFLTGGYLVADAGTSGGWMAVSIILIVVMLAMSGIISKRLKTAQKGHRSVIAKAKLFSWINVVSLLLIVLFMVNRDWL